MTVAKAIRLADYFYKTAVDVYESIQYGGNAEVVQNFVQEHNAVFRDLSGLCNNLNQLTRLAHAQGLQSTEGALFDLLPQVLNIITHLHKEMKRQK